ncbi:MAG TPA: hypothetical protein VFS20_31490 [Longimicrobium sp.]|nr:hypothetical protein [Longimicrobium sp.]
MATTLSLAQAAFWPQQLSPLQLSYAIDGTLPTTGNVLAFYPQGGAPSTQYQLPFAPVSGSGTFPIPGNDARVPWSQTPPPGNKYTWIIQLQSPAGTVYAKATLQIVPPPTTLSVVYDGASVTAQIVPVTLGSPAYYTLSVSTAGGVLSARTANAFTTTIRLALQAPLTGTPTFTLATVGAGTLSSATAAAPLPVTQPVLMSAAYDGARVTAQWMPVSGATGYTLRAYSTTGKPAFQQQVAVTQGSLSASALDSSYRFVLLAAMAQPVYTSTAPLPFLLPLPTLVSASYDGARVTAQWSPPAGSSSYTLRAYAGGGPSYQSTVSVPQGQLTAPTLNPSLAYFFTVQANASGQVSAQLPPAPMLLTFPSLTEAVYDGAGINAAWQTVASATSYTLRAYSTGGGPSYQGSVQTPQGTLAAPSLGQTAPYFFTVIANAPGYVSSTITGARVLTILPQLREGAYDLASVQATWTPVSDALVSGYTLRAYSTTAPVYSAAVSSPTAGQGTLPIPTPLATSAVYQFQVIAVVNGGVSSMTQRRMLLAAPVMSRLAYSPAAGQLIASWAASGEPGVTGYRVELQKNGAATQTANATASPHPFTQALDDGAVFQARARATDGVMLGPFSGVANAPVSLLVSATFDGFARLTATQWPLAGKTNGYGFTLDDPGNITGASYTST